MAHHPIRFLTVGVAAATLLLVSEGAPAAASKKECAVAYESAQEQRAASELVEAKASLLVCAQSSCASFIQKDCASWLTEIDQRMPTVVFEATGPEGTLEDVRVEVDGKEVASALDGKAVPVNPGRHTFTFIHPVHGRKSKKKVVVEAKKGQSVAIELGERKPEPAKDVSAPAVEPRQVPDRTWAWVAAGVGVAGLATWGTFALLGNGEESSLRDGCGVDGTCPQGDVDAVKTSYLVADIGLVTGLIAGGVATYLFLAPPTREAAGEGSARRPRTPRGPTIRVDFASRPGGAMAVVQGTF